MHIWRDTLHKCFCICLFVCVANSVETKPATAGPVYFMPFRSRSCFLSINSVNCLSGNSPSHMLKMGYLCACVASRSLKSHVSSSLSQSIPCWPRSSQWAELWLGANWATFHHCRPINNFFLLSKPEPQGPRNQMKRIRQACRACVAMGFVVTMLGGSEVLDIREMR